MRIQKTKEMVCQILRDIPESRNSDITLLIEIWKRYYPSKIKVGKTGKEGIWLEDLYALPSQDNVKRMRAHYQNDLGLYLPNSWIVAKKRKIAEEVWRGYMGEATEHKRI